MYAGLGHCPVSGELPPWQESSVYSNGLYHCTYSPCIPLRKKNQKHNQKRENNSEAKSTAVKDKKGYENGLEESVHGSVNL